MLNPSFHITSLSDVTDIPTVRLQHLILLLTWPVKPLNTSCWSITNLCTLVTWHIHSLHLHVKSAHAMKASMGTKFTVPHVLNLSTRWRWVISFTPRPLYPRKRRAGPIHYEVGWAPETAWTCLRRKNLLPLAGFEPGTHHLSLLSDLFNYPSGRGADILTKLRAG